MINLQKLRRLIRFAHKAMRHSYSPYSNYPIGAALLTSDGKIYTGTNIENSSYGLTICAERVAIFQAVSQGAKAIVAVALVCGEKRKCLPCGACRQVISEFSSDAQIVYENAKGSVQTVSLTNLLPHAFSAKDLKKAR